MGCRQAHRSESHIQMLYITHACMVYNAYCAHKDACTPQTPFQCTHLNTWSWWKQCHQWQCHRMVHSHAPLQTPPAEVTRENHWNHSCYDKKHPTFETSRMQLQRETDHLNGTDVSHTSQKLSGKQQEENSSVQDVCTQESPYLLHTETASKAALEGLLGDRVPISQKFLQCCLWSSSCVCLTGHSPLEVDHQVLLSAPLSSRWTMVLRRHKAPLVVSRI